MAIELEHRFGKDSRVRDYWVAASEGFEVQLPDGRSIGTVRQVVHEHDGKAVALLVESRSRLRRTEQVVLDADAVEEVAPWRSMLVVPPGEAREPAAAAVALHRLAAVAVGAAQATRGRSARVGGAVAAGISRSWHSVLLAAGRSAAAVRDRWPALRASVASGISAAARAVASALEWAAANVRSRSPAARAVVTHVWAAVAAAVLRVAAGFAAHVARFVRALVARLAGARSTARP